jgi:hypothetical protein
MSDQPEVVCSDVSPLVELPRLRRRERSGLGRDRRSVRGPRVFPGWPREPSGQGEWTGGDGEEGSTQGGGSAVTRRMF